MGFMDFIVGFRVSLSLMHASTAPFFQSNSEKSNGVIALLLY